MTDVLYALLIAVFIVASTIVLVALGYRWWERMRHRPARRWWDL